MSEAIDTHEVAGLTVYIDAEQLKKDTHIDIADLTTSMQQQTSLFVHYAMNTVRARRQFERWKAALEVLEAQLDGKHRRILAEEGGKVTEGLVRAAVLTDPQYKAASAKVIDARQIYQMAEVAERAFDQRKDMLLQIARDAAREQAGPLRVTANQANKDRLLEIMQKNAAATGIAGH